MPYIKESNQENPRFRKVKKKLRKSKHQKCIKLAINKIGTL